MDKIDQLLAGIDTLPLSPTPLPQLFKALTDPDSDMSRVVDLISFDPALTAKLLQTCNSAFFGRAQAVNDVAEAVNRLGFQTVYRIVATVKGAQVLRPSQKSCGVDTNELWRHSVQAAFAAQFIAEDLGTDAGMFFTAGLLHDMGKVILAEAFKKDYARVASEAKQSGRALVDSEMSAFGVNHAMLGARLLAHWKFSTEMVASVCFHHYPGAAGPLQRSAACVQLADGLAKEVKLDQEPEAAAKLGVAEGLAILGWNLEALTRYSERLTENMAFVEGMARMAG